MASPLTGGSQKRRARNRRRSFDAGPFTAMSDSLDPPTAQPNKAHLIQNCYSQDPVRGGGLVGRPGFQIAESSMGGASPRGQGVHQFTKLDGTQYTVIIQGGKFYTYNWSTRTATEVLTAANFTTASVTLSATARISFLTFADKCVVSDGVNTPFMWDGTTNGGITKLTACPVLYGPMTAYYGKLFGIKNTDRSTFVWSEESDATIGYESGGYNNAWTFGQADSEPLTRLIGTNEALYIFRAYSIAEVTGAVDTDFTTAGTRSGISETIGSSSPWSVMYSNRDIYFLDSNLRPHMIRPGGGLIELWQDVRETTRSLPRAYLADAISIEYPPANLVLFGVVEVNNAYPSAWIAYNTLNVAVPEAVSIWRGYTFTAAAIVVNADSRESLMHLGPVDGKAYDHGLPDGSIWNDNGTAITHIVHSGFMAADMADEWLFDRIDFQVRVPQSVTLTLDYDTSRTSGVSASATVAGSASFWDVMQWDVSSWAGASAEAHTAIGINGIGRWVRPRVKHAVAGEQFGFLTCRVSGTPLGAHPGAP